MNSLKQKMTMKTKNMFWAALSMTATLLMTACSSDNDMTETPVAPSTSKTIPYTVTVSDDAATTRANVGDDNRTLSFATGDKLYITGTNIQGVLNLQAGDENKTTGATFSGELTYTGDGSPAADLALTATLVSAQQTVGTQVSVDDAGAVTVNYPTTSYCTSVNDAVQKYSNLTGTSTYGAKSFTLTQQTAFLNFEITFEDGTTSGTSLSTVFKYYSNDKLCTANVTTTTEGTKVVAKFVLPTNKGRTLYNASIQMGGKGIFVCGYSNLILDGKVYNVKRTQIWAANVVAEDVGKLICTDGHIHAYNEDAACTKARVAKIMHVYGADKSIHGLALAMDNEGQMNWSTAMSTCSGKNTSTVAVTGATWVLPSRGDWQDMYKTAGVSSVVQNGFSMVGGTNMPDGYYWSSWESDDSRYAYMNTLTWGETTCTWNKSNKTNDHEVRACLRF